MGNSKNNNGDKGKGTYGRISSSSSKGSSSNKKQPRRHSSGNVPPGRSSRVKTDYSGGATKSPSARKKSKTNNAVNGGATAKSASSSKKPSSSFERNQKSAQDSKKKKVPPKSKHHTAKPNRNSIKERVASAAAAAQKKSHNSSSSKITHNSTGAYKGAGRAARKEKKYMESKRRRGDSKKKKVRQQYRMTLSECNDDVYKQRSDVPWFDAKVQDKFLNSVAAFDAAASDDDSVEQGEEETLQMPSEQILQQIDAELHSFGVYVKLTPCERAARRAFLDHVTELAVSQFDTITVRGVTHPRTLDNYSSGRDNYFHLGAGGGGGKGAATSLDDFEDSDDEEIHVAPFGSFATEEVCTFLSDVDMCLWGVVKGAKKLENAELFVGDTGNDDSDEGANAYDRAMALGNNSQCPVLTESALLRTMDAIQSAPKPDLNRPEDGVDARALDDIKSAVLEDLHRPKDGVHGANVAKVKQQNTDGNEHNGLFFIDRVGEGADDAKSVEVIDLSTNETSNGHDKAKAATKGTASSAADFEFVIDSQGVKDLGGEVEDLTKSPDVEQTSMEQADKASAKKNGVESSNEGAQKVEEFKMGELFVGGLPYEVTDVSFRQFFQQYGEVSDSFVSIERRTKKSRGFGFVTFADANVTASILTTIPGKTGMVNILGKECKVNVSERSLKEHGGKAKDLTESPDAEQTSMEQAGKASTIKNEVIPTSGAAQKVDEENVEEGDFELPTFAALGKSAQDAIDINDDSSGGDGKNEVIVVESDDDDEDSADKMSSYYSRDEGEATLTPAKSEIAIDAPASPINLLDDSSSESSNEYQVDDSSDDESLPPKTLQTSGEVLELSLTSNNNSMARKPSAGTPNQVKKKQTIGPTGKTRVKVLSALQSLTRQLRRSSFTNTIECRSKARVPIINCGTRTGFEGDIAIGGHNGVDTSNYAMDQVKRFNSFASIVLLLKVLMAQQGFDKPFTGGMGSYKLYVLVAFHMERHLANGGTDRPSEILISLLFRYGCIGKCHDEATSTDLERLQKREDPITCDGGMCDFVPMFRLSDCVDMFRECHARLFDRIQIVDDFNGDGEKISYLSSFIDCFRLREARELSVRRSKLCDDICRPIERDHPGKVTPGRRIGKVFSAPKNDVQKLKRGPRGSLLPKKRPDLEAQYQYSLRSNGDAEIIQRGMKNRKNNKKQKRDAPGRSFASRHSI